MEFPVDLKLDYLLVALGLILPTWLLCQGFQKTITLGKIEETRCNAPSSHLPASNGPSQPKSTHMQSAQI